MTTRSYDVEAEDGVRLHVREAGPEDAPPVVFIHGWSQSWLSWRRQLEDAALAREFRLVAYDLRGHGSSDAPRSDGAYTDRQWAADLAAVIAQRELSQPVLVGWSFGGYVTCDYLRAYGEAAVSGVNFVGWAVMIGNTERERRLAGPGFNDYFADSISEDLPTNIEAMRGFVRACTHEPLSPADFETVLCFNIIVPPFVRRATALRPQLDNTELLSMLTVPVLVSQGAEDRVTRRAAADHIVGCCTPARASVYEDAGHMPFMEAPERFNRELASFARLAHARAGSTRDARGSAPGIRHGLSNEWTSRMPAVDQ